MELNRKGGKMAERVFKIETNPYDEEQRMYKKANIKIKDGVTVLVGCNGCGKTTFLGEIEKKLKKQNIPVITFDNLSQGGANARKTAIEKHDFRFLASSKISSEGENIVLNISNKAKEIGSFIRNKGVLEEDRKYKKLANAIISTYREKSANTEIEEIEEEPNEYWILLDAIDSGLSIDNVIDVKKYLFDTIVEDAKKNNFTVFIVVSANEYEMCVGEKCFNVQDGKYEDISSYEDFKSVVLRTRDYKVKEGF